MADIKWSEPGAWTAAFGASDLNSLANSGEAHSSLGAPLIDTTTSRELYFQAEFIGGSISPTGAADVVFFLRPRNSANTAYVDGETGTVVANQTLWMMYPHVILGLRIKAASAQLVMSKIELVPPGLYHPGFLNRAGVALNASGNQVNFRLLTEAAV